MSLPNDIISEIINLADLSVDTRVELSRTYYVRPRRVEIPKELEYSLNNRLELRAKHIEKYKNSKTIERFGAYHKTGMPFTSLYDMRIIESDSDTAVQFQYRSINIQQFYPMLKYEIKTTTCDMHTGETLGCHVHMTHTLVDD